MWLIASLLFVLALVTRLLSAALYGSKPVSSGVKSVPMVPYWFPVIGHMPEFFLNQESLFNWARKIYSDGIFSLNLVGTTHNIIFQPPLGTSLLNVKNEIGDQHSISKYLMKTNFGYPSSDADKYDGALPDIVDCYHRTIMSNSGLADMANVTISHLKSNITTFVSYAERFIDQTHWERVSATKLVEKPNGEQVVEANLYPLIRDFVVQTANPSLFGTDFMNNFPDYWDHLWVLDRAFFYLATGLPRWLPIPLLTKGHIALKRMTDSMTQLEIALEKEANGKDPGNEWPNLEDVGELVKARQHAYRKSGLSPRARAAFELSLSWATNANSNPLIFWLINRIYADKTLLAQIREEIAPYVRASKPSQEFSFPEPPRIETIDLEGLETKCPLLKSAYVESLRLDVSSWSTKIMRDDLVVSARGKESRKYLVKKGSFAHVVHEIHHHDPAYWDSPDEWIPDRHIRKIEGDGKTVTEVDAGTIRSYSGGPSMCKGRFFAAKEILLVTAAIVALWDIDPAGGGPWKIPKVRKATGTHQPRSNVRVWIKRRNLS